EAVTSLRCYCVVLETGTAGAIIGCRRLSAKGGLGCPVLHHEIEDSLTSSPRIMTKIKVFAYKALAISRQIYFNLGLSLDSNSVVSLDAMVPIGGQAY
ncbi:MAG: hypothetical protein RPU52_10140, partial [Candidatus Sedimenticola sp. (ex Thyasira tokunagai)]